MVHTFSRRITSSIQTSWAPSSRPAPPEPMFTWRRTLMLRAAADTDVMIVGAGPVGLFLANECARRGLRYRIVETKASQSVHSKALAIFPRTLEILDMAGLVGPFLQHANRVTSVAVVTRGRTLARMRFAPKKALIPSLPWSLRMSQSACSWSSCIAQAATSSMKPPLFRRHSRMTGSVSFLTAG